MPVLESFEFPRIRQRGLPRPPHKRACAVSPDPGTSPACTRETELPPRPFRRSAFPASSAISNRFPSALIAPLAASSYGSAADGRTPGSCRGIHATLNRSSSNCRNVLGGELPVSRRHARKLRPVHLFEKGISAMEMPRPPGRPGMAGTPTSNRRIPSAARH